MSTLAIPVLLALMQQCAPGHAPNTLMAVVQTESKRDPLAMLDNTTSVSRHFEDARTAASVTSSLIERGHSVDLGLMQINSKNLSWLGLTVEQAFDACSSIRAGVRVLVAAYEGGATMLEQQASLRRALSRYNTGDPQKGFANGYVQRVQDSASSVLLPALQVSPASGQALPGGVAASASPQPPSQVTMEDPLHERGGSDPGPEADLILNFHKKRK